MKPVHLCVPVLNRYDLLRELLYSVVDSTVVPKAIYVLNNGRDGEKLESAIRGLVDTKYVVMTPKEPLGLAESWNWFIREVPEERVIVNDDILLAPHSLEQMVSTPGDIVTALLGTNACSCFLIRDICVQRVGLFDEEISPGYAYFEDCDYAERLAQLGMDFTGVECGVQHAGSRTLAAMSSSEQDEHHKRFVIAQNNFIAKWGRMPHGKERQFA